MSCVELIPGDPWADTFVFYRSDDGGVPRLRQRYADLVCTGRRCGKFDEYRALERGVDDDVRIASRRDLVATCDHCIVVSERFKQVIEAKGIDGIGFVPAGKRGRFVIRPLVVVAVDKDRSQMEFKGRACDVCGRYRLTQFAPSLDAMEVVSNPMTLFSAAIRPEHRSARFTTLYGSEQVAKLLQSEGVTGIDWRATFSGAGS